MTTAQKLRLRSLAVRWGDSCSSLSVASRVLGGVCRMRLVGLCADWITCLTLLQSAQKRAGAQKRYAVGHPVLLSAGRPSLCTDSCPVRIFGALGSKAAVQKPAPRRAKFSPKSAFATCVPRVGGVTCSKRVLGRLTGAGAVSVRLLDRPFLQKKYNDYYWSLRYRISFVWIVTV